MLHEVGIDRVASGENLRDICDEHKNVFKSAAFEAIHSAASGLFSVGAITREVMRGFDEACISSRNEHQTE